MRSPGNGSRPHANTPRDKEVDTQRATIAAVFCVSTARARALGGACAAVAGQLGEAESVSDKREKSLENLASRFLRIFLAAKEPVVLESVSRVLMHTEDPVLVKTKIRRLYDIVNVFKSIAIVQRVPVAGMKPSFQW